MSNILRNIVRLNAVKALSMPQSIGIRSIGGARSLWHMSNSTTPITMKHKCSGIVGCNCGCGVRFASTNGKFFVVIIVQLCLDLLIQT